MDIKNPGVDSDAIGVVDRPANSLDCHARGSLGG